MVWTSTPSGNDCPLTFSDVESKVRRSEEQFYMKKGFPGDSEVKYLPAEQETWVQSLGQEDSLEEGIAAHSSIHAWRILWMEEPGRL